MSILDRAAVTHPDAWWWVKVNGVDLVHGLGESVNGKWSGDVDLNDGTLQQQYKSYQEQVGFINFCGLKERSCHQHLVQDLNRLLEDLLSDIKFIHEGKFALSQSQ